MANSIGEFVFQTFSVDGEDELVVFWQMIFGKIDEAFWVVCLGFVEVEPNDWRVRIDR